MRNAFVTVSAIAVLACLGGAGASARHDPGQSSARVANPPGDGTSRIRGRVLNADTGSPLRRALVLLQTPEGRSLKWVTTDATGTYEFSDLASGTYAVKAQKDGFLSRRYGARESAGMGMAVRVGRDALVERVDIALPPGCALAGRVLDASGEPVLLAFVGVGVRYRDLDGTERFVAVDGAVTDDLGRYRFWGLHPGKYYLLAEPPLPSAGRDDAHEARSAATYYPGVGSLTGARQVELAAGREASIEIVLQTVSPAHVSGTVLDESGHPLSGLTYVSYTDSRGFSSGGPAHGLRSRSTFEGLPPGELHADGVRAAGAGTEIRVRADAGLRHGRRP